MNIDLYDNARWLIGAIARGLQARPGDGTAEVLERLAVQRLVETDFAPPEPRTLPVLRHLPQAIGETLLLDADLAAALAAVEDGFRWLQSKAYNDGNLGQGFVANYGWAEIIGPNGFFPGEDFLLGVLLLGPDRHYRDHYHPAPELYWPLTSGSLWSRDGAPFSEKPQGATIWHPPMTVHATRTEETPLLAVYAWTRDTGTPAALCP